MKKKLYSTTCLFLLISFFSINLCAQELVKPQKTHAVKKAETKKSPETVIETTTNSNQDSQESGSLTKKEAETNVDAKGTTQGENPSNATRDNSDYQTKKENWIKSNPEKYKAKSGNPNLKFITEQELNALPADQQSAILADEENYIIIR